MENDEWGKDPTVRGLRRSFAAVEAEQKLFLDRLGINRFDLRLSMWRKMALHVFEEYCAASTRQGLHLQEDDIADLYVRCLAKVLETRGISVGSDVLRRNDKIERLWEGAR